MTDPEITSTLAGRMNMPEVKRVVTWALTEENHVKLLELTRSSERRVAVNALWVLTHLRPLVPEWFAGLKDTFIDALLVETETAKKRMLLQILREQDFGPDDVRTDLLDYCLGKINSECEPYAVRCFAIYIAFKLCRHYPELCAELSTRLDLLTLQSLSPGLRCALRHTRTSLTHLPPSH